MWRFAFDSEGELHKIAQHAPGSAVFVRLRVDDSTSIFPLSRKFGAEARGRARAAPARAEPRLQPYGVTFHVGSQCTDAERVAAGDRRGRAAARAARGRRHRARDAQHGRRLPGPLRRAGAVDRDDRRDDLAALDELLPYVPPHLAAEPGRYLVAESAVLVASVLGREVRAGENWLYLDVGAYNGLIETQQTREPVALPALELAGGPRARAARAVHGHGADLRQLRHDVLRRLAAGDDRRGRPGLHRLGRRVHDQLRVELQRLPAARCRSSSG